MQTSQIENAVILIEDSGSMHANEAANKLAKKLSLQVHTIPENKKNKRFEQAAWQLVFTKSGLVLRLSSEPTWGDIQVDFVSAALKYRQLYGGGRNEALAKAIGIKGKKTLHVLDCTAGMGTDSFVMASVGATVTMLERNPIVVALLDDALYRAQTQGAEISERLTLVQRDAVAFINAYKLSPKLKQEAPIIDVIYIDPMFPHKKKSALVKKEMRAFQQLLGPDHDSQNLLSAAINYVPKRIVVKRPSSAPALDNEHKLQPSVVIRSKKHRFDVYLCQQSN